MHYLLPMRVSALTPSIGPRRCLQSDHPVGVPLILCVFVPSNSESDITLSIITLMLPAFPEPPLQMMPILSSACMVYPGSEDGSLNSISVIVAGMSER